MSSFKQFTRWVRSYETFLTSNNQGSTCAVSAVHPRKPEKMWRRINLSFYRDVQALNRRNYLTESYRLNQEWAQRLQTPTLQKVNVENLYYEIDSKFAQQKKISPVDVDIYANKIVDNRHMDEIADLVQKLRTTEEATNLYDSTQHALIRNYIENNNLDSLVYVLNSRSQFGIFMDNHIYNILLNQLIDEKNFKLGARFATLFALQEDFSNPISTTMSLLTCYKFLNTLEPFDDLVEKPVEVEETVTKPKKKKEEIIKVRVRYIINPYFDDHFNLRNSYHLLGKTFLYLADEVQNETLANSLKLLGYSLYEKFEDGNKYLATAKQSTFFKESVEIVKTLAAKVENLDANEPAKHFFDSVSSLTSLKDDKVEDVIESLVKKSVQEHEAKDIEEQKNVYAKWIVEREEKLNQEIDRLNRIQRLLSIEKVQKDLQTEEKRLWFFENEDKIDLEIDGNRRFYPKRWFGKKKKPRVVDENYIPPDVDSRRNVK